MADELGITDQETLWNPLAIQDDFYNATRAVTEKSLRGQRPGERPVVTLRSGDHYTADTDGVEVRSGMFRQPSSNMPLLTA